MSVLRYPRRSVAADVAAGASGIAICALPLAAGAPPGWLGALLAGGLALFAAFTVESCARLRRRYRVDEAGLRVDPAGTAIRWDDLDALELRYYSTRRDGRGGWLQLRLRAGGRGLRVDSRLQDFEQVLERALAAAARRDVALPAATVANLHALGVGDDMLARVER